MEMEFNAVSMEEWAKLLFSTSNQLRSGLIGMVVERGRTKSDSDDSMVDKTGVERHKCTQNHLD